MSYEYRGATADGLLVFVAAYSGGGSGTFYYLHILAAASAGASDDDGSTYSRLNLTLVRTLCPRRPLAGRRKHLR